MTDSTPTGITVSVDQEAESPLIDDVYLLYATDRIALFQINTKEKYPQPLPLSFNSHMLQFQGATIRWHNLPFALAELVYSPGRYCLNVALFDFELLNELSFRDGGEHLYQRVSDEEPAP